VGRPDHLPGPGPGVGLLARRRAPAGATGRHGRRRTLAGRASSNPPGGSDPCRHRPDRRTADMSHYARQYPRPDPKLPVPRSGGSLPRTWRRCASCDMDGSREPLWACRSAPASSYTGPAGGTGTAATTAPAMTWTASRPDRPARRTGSARSKTINKRGSIMGSTEAPPLTVVQPGGGAHGDLGTIGVVFKLWGRDTGGALAIVEHPFPVGAL